MQSGLIKNLSQRLMGFIGFDHPDRKQYIPTVYLITSYYSKNFIKAIGRGKKRFV